MNIYTFLSIGALFLGTSSVFAETKSQYDHFYTASDPLDVRERKGVELVQNAVAYYQKHGLETALKAFKNQNGPFCTQYKYGYSGIILKTAEGTILAYCKFPGLIGKNVLSWKSPDGITLSFQEIRKAVKENPHGQLIEHILSSYSPITGKPSPMKVFAREVDGLTFINVIYDDTPTHKDLIPVEDIECAKNPKNAEMSKASKAQQSTK